MSSETKTFIDDYAANYPLLTTHSIGSSLKICLVAEGAADIYPRLGPTMEWDTGAAHAIVSEAGLQLQKYENEAYSKHAYNKENLLNGWFVVS
jgi:3'(2'), 5'-bisphosphate nucleotidase